MIVTPMGGSMRLSPDNRANAYREAGADVIFVEAITSLKQAREIPGKVPGPLLYNWVFKGVSLLIPLADLLEIGYRYVLQADVLYVVSHALRGYFRDLKTTGSYGQSAERMLSFDEFNTLIGLDEIMQAEARNEPHRHQSGGRR